MTLILLSCCGEEQTAEQKAAAEQKEKQANALYMTNDIQNYVQYIRDPRTGLCFAASRVSGRRYVYSPIECTDKVKQFLINPSQ